MFAHSLVDTLRLAFGQVVHHHKSHAQAAASLARWIRWLRASETLLMMGVAIAAFAAAFGKGNVFSVVSAVLASLALTIFLIHVMFDFESAARAHHECSTRLWHIREQYRALLSDLSDGAIDPEAARIRRSVLLGELHAIYDSAPALARRVFAASRSSVNSVEEAALADEEIDRFLPKSLHAAKSAPAST